MAQASSGRTFLMMQKPGYELFTSNRKMKINETNFICK